MPVPYIYLEKLFIVNCSLNYQLESYWPWSTRAF